MRIPNYDSAIKKLFFQEITSLHAFKHISNVNLWTKWLWENKYSDAYVYNLLYYDKIYLYSKNLEQPKYQGLLGTFAPISRECGYDVIEASNDEIMPVSEIDDESQKIVIFDDFVCEKNQKPLIEYFIRGRHKNCSVIYLSQSYYLTPKDIRLNCSHFTIFDSPSAPETNRMCKEVNVNKNKFLRATAEPYSFAYIDKINKTMRKNFNENI